jgi:glutathione reductase (NADPH)
MAREYDLDLFVIGAGSGGVRASRIAASYGARVVVAEERYLGGTCVNAGCIPKKLFVYAAEFSDIYSEGAGFGWTPGQAGFDWRQLIANKDRQIARLNGVYENLLIQAGVRIVRGRARILDWHTVEANGERFSTEYILAATGSWPSKPEIPGVELGITSNEAFHLERFPNRVVIVGGGYIALEFGGIFHGLGAHASLIHRGDKLLRGYDEDIRTAIGEELRKREMELHLEATITRLENRNGKVLARLSSGPSIDADLVMFATGRHPNSTGFGLAEAGVALDSEGAVIVDEYSRSSVPSIFAIGDLTNRKNLTPVAIAEGHAVADTLFGGKARTMNHENIASAVFSEPPIAAVGLTEAEARRRLGEVDIYKSTFKPLRHTLSGRDERALMKLVVEPKSGRVIGAHMMGPDAGEIIQGIAIAIKCGATKADFDATVGIHPTAAEEFVTMRTKSA